MKIKEINDNNIYRICSARITWNEVWKIFGNFLFSFAASKSINFPLCWCAIIVVIIISIHLSCRVFGSIAKRSQFSDREFMKLFELFSDPFQDFPFFKKESKDNKINILKLQHKQFRSEIWSKNTFSCSHDDWDWEERAETFASHHRVEEKCYNNSELYFSSWDVLIIPKKLLFLFLWEQFSSSRKSRKS